MSKTDYKYRLFVFILTLTIILIYCLSLSVPNYLDDRVVLYQAYNLDVPFDFFRWLQLRYVGLKSFFISKHYNGSLFAIHSVSISIHILNTLLIYLLLHLLNVNRWLSLFVVVVWAIHPLNSQAVVYISQRFTLVATFWLLLSFISFILFLRYWQVNGKSKLKETSFWCRSIFYFTMIAIFFLLALFSKQSAAFFPIYLTVAIFIVSKSKRAILLFALMITAIILSLYFSPELLGKIDTLTRETNSYSRVDYFSTQLYIIIIYISKLLIPINLTLESSVALVKFGSLIFYISLVFHTFFISTVIYIAKKKNNLNLILALMFFYFSMSVESSFIPIQDLYFEHRMYLPSASLIFIFFTLFNIFFDKVNIKEILKLKMLLIIFALFSYLTANRVMLWQKPYDFYKNEYEVNPGSSRAMSSYAKELAKAGEKKEALELFLKAYNDDLKKGIIRQSNLVGLLTILIDLKYYKDALKLGHKAIRATKTRPKLQAVTYAHLALVYYRMNECGFASGWSKKALSLDSSVTLAKQLIYLCGNTK
ncbi:MULTISPECIES: hypothetical protein [Pseudoalteromonas]|uniref:hypothetical protein n=1 Tax=Pseudoalteromonas TaxID=53246 RepID=UPI001583102B|nr:MULTISPECIES: hypothetical protein [Pseudoalteromonas]MDI4652075.1 hypothetical protein [Pseudoalteromonas shioyasakiensis]NUJ38400.1 hypothetical protein [Pseudoalteromonas sp. 0303]